MIFAETMYPELAKTNDICQLSPGYCDSIWKTYSNISPLYQLDTFDKVILTCYFIVLGILAIYGAYRIKQVVQFWRYRKLKPMPKAIYTPAELPVITVQLPLFNEMYVVERLLKAVSEMDYPREKLEIQVLDDSTDETVKVASEAVARYRALGFDISYIHRTDRTGFKAGALENGMKLAKGELLAIFDADFVPNPDFLRKLVDYFTDPLVGCAQMRWEHINGDYNLLTRLQTLMLDGHFVIEQTVRNRSGSFFNFNGTAGIWRKRTIENSGGWQHDTLTEDSDLSYRAQLMGWKFVYLLDEAAPSEIPVEINAFKAQQRRWAKGVMQVGIKLFRRIWYAPLSLQTRIEMFLRLTGNISYPLMILVSFLQFPLLLVRYNQGFYHLMIFDVPLLFLSTISVCLFYGTVVWYLDERKTPRLLHLPLMMALGIGLSFSNARAVIEALIGYQTEFVRTPKYKVEAGNDETWKKKKYQRKRGFLPFLELGFALYFLCAIIYAARMSMWVTIPFLALFCFGYGYMGVMSFAQLSAWQRFAGFFRPLASKNA